MVITDDPELAHFDNMAVNADYVLVTTLWIKEKNTGIEIDSITSEGLISVMISCKSTGWRWEGGGGGVSEDLFEAMIIRTVF